MFYFFRIFLIMLSAATLIALKANAQAVTVNNLAVTITSGLTATISGDFRNQSAGTIDNSGIITVSGNWANNASNTVFSTNAGTVQFIGTSLQNIGGTNATSFYNLTLNNSLSSATRYVAGNNQTVKNTLTLSAGEINLAGYTITLGTSAAIPGSLNYTSGWMYGGTFMRWFSTSVIANGASAGLFPIGSSADYRPFFVSAPTTSPTTGGTISVSHTNIANTTAASFTDINVIIDRIYNSYWDVSKGNGLAGGTYNMRTDGTGFTGIATYSNLRLVLAGNYVGTFNTNGGNNTNPQVNRTGITAVELVNRFYWGYPAGSGPLPIELISFSACPHSAEVKINWVTASEINSDFFNVERSVDGFTYDVINNQKAAGNSTDIKSYFAFDMNPLSGTSYYRLKETDYDGSVSYSSPVAVNFYNNDRPLEIITAGSMENNITININSPSVENYVLEFYDATGKLISAARGRLKTGNQDLILHANTESSGIYLFTLRTTKSSISKKIFIDNILL